MPKGKPNTHYTGEYKQEVVESMLREKQPYNVTVQMYDISGHESVSQGEWIYLEEDPEGLYVSLWGRRNKVRPGKMLQPVVGEDLLEEVQRLRDENTNKK